MQTSPTGLEDAVTADVEAPILSPVADGQSTPQSNDHGARRSPPRPADSATRRPVPQDLLQPQLTSPSARGILFGNRPAPIRENDREVSWEPGSTLPPANPASAGNYQDLQDSITNGFSSNNNNNSRVDMLLKTLKSVNPLESEAESYIQRSLEERDPTMGRADGSEAQRTILGPNVPLNVDADTFGEHNKTAAASSAAAAPTPKAKRGHRKSITSTAEDLVQLAMDMTELNQQHGDESRHFDATDLETADVLHAGRPLPPSLMQRAKSKMMVDHGNAAVEVREDGPHDTAAERWSNLKRKAQAVTTTFSPPRSRLTFSNSTNSDDDGDAAGLDSMDIEGNDNGRPVEENARTNSKSKRNLMMSRSQSQRKRSREAASRFRRATKDKTTALRVRNHYKDFDEWFQVKRIGFYSYMKFILCIIVPATAISAVLFYVAGNPRVGYDRRGSSGSSSLTAISDAASSLVLDATSNSTSLKDDITTVLRKASWSWWILFVLVRQLLTLSLSFATQSLVIDYAILRSKGFVRVFGSFVTLFVIQSRGWPFVIFIWSVYDFAFLYGGHPWTEHWLWWQSAIDMLNTSNPSAKTTASSEYFTILIIMITVSFTVMLKRFWMSLFLGKQTYFRYGGDLARVMRKALLIGQVSGLARDKEDLGLDVGDVKNDLGIDLHDEYATLVDDDGSTATDGMKDSVRSISSPCVPAVKGTSLTRFQKSKIDQLLGAWEEPEITKEQEERVPIAAIIQFRQSLTYLNTSRPFSMAFGPASLRTECIQSSEAVYARLVGASSVLKFDLIALLAVNDRGEVDEAKLKELIRLFRPDREGNLSLVDFAKSIDTVYKEIRLLRASVANSSKMDRAFENIVNIIFYFFVALCVLAGIGIAPDTILSPIGAFIVGLGFMIGSASSKYLEGILFILVRRPFDIGDRINISDPLTDTSVTGSPGWIVKDVNLYSTTVIFASTNEEATYSNGSLASSRTINMARSFKAQVSCTIKFPIDAPYERLLVFKKSIEQFVLSRPREFSSFVAFRATTVQADLGYVEYVVYALHRESWQEAPTIAQSKADLNSFALELSKKMGLRYRSPPMPVDLTLLKQASDKIGSSEGDGVDVGMSGHRQRADTIGSIDLNSVSAMFEPRR